MLSATAFAPTPVWAIDPSASPAIASGAEALDGSEEAFHLTVMADFNRDGIVDIAKATAGDSSGPGVLTLSLGKTDGTLR
jgi:hypothetical protein